jgi:hypothetical protein
MEDMIDLAWSWLLWRAQKGIPDGYPVTPPLISALDKMDTLAMEIILKGTGNG